MPISCVGGAGNDVYFVDNIGDFVLENLNEGNDAVFSSIDYTLTANVETWSCKAVGNLPAYRQQCAVQYALRQLRQQHA